MAFQKRIEASFTRPADTLAYTVGDVIANSVASPVIMTFAGAAATAEAGGRIVAATLIDSVAAATKPLVDLWLFDTTVIMQGDNVAFAPTDAEAGTVVAVIPFLTAGDWSVGDLAVGGNAVYAKGNLNMAYVCALTTTSLFGILIARNAYVPASAEVIKIRLVVELS